MSKHTNPIGHILINMCIFKNITRNLKFFCKFELLLPRIRQFQNKRYFGEDLFPLF